MNKLITIFLVFMASYAGAVLSPYQANDKYGEKVDTKTYTNPVPWTAYYREDFHFVYSSSVVKSSACPDGVVVRASGTVEAKDIRANRLYGDGTGITGISVSIDTAPFALKSDVNTSSNALQSQINSNKYDITNIQFATDTERTARINQDILIGGATGQEEAARMAADNEIKFSTHNIQGLEGTPATGSVYTFMGSSWAPAASQGGGGSSGDFKVSITTGFQDVTGTPSGSTYLRGDKTWSTPAGASLTHFEKMPKDFYVSGFNNNALVAPISYQVNNSSECQWFAVFYGTGDYVFFDGVYNTARDSGEWNIKLLLMSTGTCSSNMWFNIDFSTSNFNAGTYEVHESTTWMPTTAWNNGVVITTFTFTPTVLANNIPYVVRIKRTSNSKQQTYLRAVTKD